MGANNSRFNEDIKRQENALTKFNKTDGAKALRENGYTRRQVNGFFRSEYHNQRESGHWVSDHDADKACGSDRKFSQQYR
jgi:hypothetical protein